MGKICPRLSEGPACPYFARPVGANQRSRVAAGPQSIRADTMAGCGILVAGSGPAHLSYQDYIEQLTFLLFLKMADEQTGAGSELSPQLTAFFISSVIRASSAAVNSVRA